MMTMWLVLSGRWDVSGADFASTPGGAFFASSVLAGCELAAEMYWLLKVFA